MHREKAYCEVWILLRELVHTQACVQVRLDAETDRRGPDVDAIVGCAPEHEMVHPPTTLAWKEAGACFI